MARRRTLVVAVLLLALWSNQMVGASPNGLGSEANEGCLCHTPQADTKVVLSGFPDAYEANTTYTLTLEVISAIEAMDNRSQGGFRMLVSEGQVVHDNTTMQELDNGWTHTYNGSSQRTWTFEWTSPTSNDSATTFTVHGNAVNGNNAQTGDAWSTMDLVVPGVMYEGDLTPDEGVDGVSQTDRLVLAVGLLLIFGLLWSVARP
jgi:hypothetical protein